MQNKTNWKNILHHINTALRENNLPALNIITNPNGYLIKHEILSKNLNMLLPFIDEPQLFKIYTSIYAAKYSLIKDASKKNIMISRIITILNNSLPNRINTFDHELTLSSRIAC